MKKLLLLIASIAAFGLSFLGLSVLFAGAASAQPSTTCDESNIERFGSSGQTQAGTVTNCFGWSLDFELDNTAGGTRNPMGLFVRNVRLADNAGTENRMVGWAAFPGMPVRYENNQCGPYVDLFSFENPYEGEVGVNVAIGTVNGQQVLELGSSHRIGGYIIYTAYYFTDSGEMHQRIFARGMACATPTDHEHYPFLLVDMDAGPGLLGAGGGDDELLFYTDGGFQRELTEGTHPAQGGPGEPQEHRWVVRDSVTGESVVMEYDVGGFEPALANCNGNIVPGECNTGFSQLIPPSAYENNFISSRTYGGLDAYRWPAPGCNLDPGGAIFCNGETTFNNGFWGHGSPAETILDPMVVVRGFLDHTEVGSNAANPDDWHTTGVRMRFIPDPLVVAPPTPVPPTSVPPTSVPPTSVPPTSVPPTSVPPTSVPPTSVPGGSDLPFGANGQLVCTAATNVVATQAFTSIDTGGDAVNLSVTVVATGDMESTGINADTATLEYRVGFGSWQVVDSVNGAPAGGSATLAGSSISNPGSIDVRVTGNVTYAVDERYCFQNLSVTSAGGTQPTPVPPTPVPPTPVVPTPVPPGPGGCVLVDEVAQTQSVNAGGSVTCTIVVPAGSTSLDVDISGGSGEADLYVNFGSPAVLAQTGSVNPATLNSSSTFCAVWENGNTEDCSYTNPTAGTWYVTLADYSNLAFSGVSVVADYETTGGPAPTPVPPGSSPCTNTSWNVPNGSAGASERCSFVVPAGTASLTVDMTGPAFSSSNEADLYVQFGSTPAVVTTDANVPADSATQCTVWEDGNNATCEFTNPAAGTWNILVADFGNRGFSGISVTTSW